MRTSAYPGAPWRSVHLLCTSLAAFVLTSFLCWHAVLTEARDHGELDDPENPGILLWEAGLNPNLQSDHEVDAALFAARMSLLLLSRQQLAERVGYVLPWDQALPYLRFCLEPPAVLTHPTMDSKGDVIQNEPVPAAPKDGLEWVQVRNGPVLAGLWHGRVVRLQLCQGY